MRPFKKCMLFLLSILLLTGTLATQTFAAEEAVQPISWTYVNPVYADMELCETEQDPSCGIAVVDDITYCSNAEDAAKVLRAGLKERQSVIPVYMDNWNVTQEFLQQTIDIAVAHTGDPKEGDYIHEHLSSMSCYAQGGAIGYVITYTPRYLSNANQEEAVDKAVEKLLKKLDLWNATDYEKVRGIYDWMCANITYDYAGLANSKDDLEYTAYDAIINNSAVCQGYSSLFYRLALELGVDTRVVCGFAFNGESTEAHAWNIVKLGKKYYDVDSTWDASYSQSGLDYAYFLKGSTNFGTDHFPGSDYTSAAFNAAYPISTTDYTHNYVASVTKPTCTEAGYITYTCTACGDTYTEGGAPATGHTYGDWYISKQPTCVEPGQISKDCVNCDDAQHIELQKADHTYEAVVTAPAVGQQGYTTYTCTGCGDSYMDNYTDALAGVAKIGGTAYNTTAAALAEAKSGDTVILIADAHEENTNLTVDEGVTLNVGRFDLHCRSLNVLTGGMITGGEYSQNGDWGRIYLPADSRMVMSGTVVKNYGSIGLIPVWDDAASCYVFGGAFFNASRYVVAVDETAKTLSFKFIPSLRTKLMQGYFQDANEMRDNGLRLVLRLTWPGADEDGNINGQAQQDFVYSSEFVKTYMAALGNARFTFLLTGYDTLVTDAALAEMTITPMFISDNGMVFAGQTVELADYISE